MNITTIGKISLGMIKHHQYWKAHHKKTHQGTIVTLKPTMAHTLKLVSVLTTISTRPVNARPIRECTVVMRFMDRPKYAKKAR